MQVYVKKQKNKKNNLIHCLYIEIKWSKKERKSWQQLNKLWAISRPSEMYQQQFENSKRKILVLMKLEMEAFCCFVLKMTSKIH